MELFGMGTGEILLVFIVVLIIWGPGKMPEIARQIGKAVNTLKQTTSDLTAQVKKELEEEEVRERTHSPHPDVTGSVDVSKPLPAATKETNTGED